jgi:hypothetical protein
MKHRIRDSRPDVPTDPIHFCMKCKAADHAACQCSKRAARRLAAKLKAVEKAGRPPERVLSGDRPMPPVLVSDLRELSLSMRASPKVHKTAYGVASRLARGFAMMRGYLNEREEYDPK